jgi:predicted DNA-binding transcriptional regulator AlpA
MQTTKGSRRLIGRSELQRRVPYSMTHIWRLEQRDVDPFPKRIAVGENRIAWDEAAVDQWIEARIRSSRKIASPSRQRKPAAVDAGGC